MDLVLSLGLFRVALLPDRGRGFSWNYGLGWRPRSVQRTPSPQTACARTPLVSQGSPTLRADAPPDAAASPLQGLVILEHSGQV